MKTNVLEFRKQLLIAESDLNRALLIRDSQVLCGEIDHTPWAARAGTLIGLWRMFRPQSAPGADNHKGSWVSVLTRFLVSTWTRKNQ